jgi:hypothetical protein
MHSGYRKRLDHRGGNYKRGQGCADKKENKNFSHFFTNTEGSGAKSHMTNDLLIYGENICAFPHKLETPSPYMTFNPILSEFPYI